MNTIKKIGLIVIFLSGFVAKAQFFGKMVDAPVTSGQEGNYIFCFDNASSVNNVPPAYFPQAAYCSIQRSENGNSFREIGRTRPARTERELNEIFETKNFIAEMLKVHPELKTAAEVIALFQKPGNKYGLLLIEPIKVIKALGLVYLDKKAEKGKKYFYRVELVRNDGTRQIVIQGNVVSGKANPLLDSYKFIHKASSVMAIDSAVSVRWQKANSPNKAVYKFHIYASTNHDPNFRVIDTGRAAYQIDTLNIGIVKKSNPGIIWKMFCKPIDYLGNEGLASDTVTIVSFGNGSIPFIEEFNSKDTTGGIWLSWKKLPQEDYMTGILLTRSLGTEDVFHILDTLTLASTSYLDKSAQHGILYNYEIQPLVAPINKISMDDVIPVRQSGMHRSRAKILPSNTLEVKQVGRKIILTWDKSNDPDTKAYVVYSSADINHLTQVGGFQADTMFVDTTSNGDFEHQTRYYAVATYSFNGNFGPKSKVVSIQPRLAINLSAPTQLIVRRQENDIIIDWDDTRPNDTRVEGYYVFKRKNKEPYKQITEKPVLKNQYVDTAEKTEGRYEYVVSALSSLGSESPVSLSNYIDFEKKTISPPPAMAEIFVRNIPPGIEISWPALKQENIAGFNVYRKKENETEFSKLTSIRSNQNAYWDKVVRSGERYYYLVTYSLKNGAESVQSCVKVIERTIIDSGN